MARPATAAVRLLTGEREPVRLATTVNIALYGLQTIDGVATEVGDRVLVKNQADASENGIYTASEGQWFRAADARTARTMQKGTTVHVAEGSANGGKTFVFNTPNLVIGDTAIDIVFYVSDDVIGDLNAAVTAGIASIGAAADTEILNVQDAGVPIIDQAQKWATENEDVGVNDGVHPAGYSAYHWMRKALAQASAAAISATTAVAAAAGVILPPVTANTMLVDNAAGTARQAKTFPEVRNALAAAAFVANRATIKALDPIKEKAATTYGEGRGVNGTFLPVLTSSLSAADTATKALDTTEAVYVASTQNALYTWVRHYDSAHGVSATWFGLKADGTTDDHTALEKAASFLGGTGGVVILPRGTIDVSNVNLESFTYVTFRGQGSLSGGASTGTIIRSTAATNDAINCKSSIGLTFERIQFLHSSTLAGKRFFNFSRGTAGTDGVYMAFRGCSFNTISTASASSKFLYLDGATRGYFDQCSFTGRGAFVFGGDATNIGFSNVMTFVQCSFNPVSEYPILNPGEAWTFSGCTFEANTSPGAGYARAMSSTVGADRVAFKALTISGCWFGDVTTAGGQWLALSVGEGLTITGCTVGGQTTSYFAALGGGDTGVPATSGVRGVSMFGNRFTGCVAFNLIGTQAAGTWVQGMTVGGNSSNTVMYAPANLSGVVCQLTNSPNKIEGLPNDQANFAFTVGQNGGMALTVSKQLVQPVAKVTLSNSSTSAQAVFASAVDTITVAAATTYRFRMRLCLNTGATSHTTAFGFGGTATFITCKYTSIAMSSAANTLGTAQMLRVDSTAATVLTAASTAVATDIVLEGTIRVSAGGTIIPQVTFSAGPTGICETDIDSFFEIEEMGSNTLASIGNAA